MPSPDQTAPQTNSQNRMAISLTLWKLSALALVVSSRTAAVSAGESARVPPYAQQLYERLEHSVVPDFFPGFEDDEDSAMAGQDASSSLHGDDFNELSARFSEPDDYRWQAFQQELNHLRKGNQATIIEGTVESVETAAVTTESTDVPVLVEPTSMDVFHFRLGPGTLENMKAAYLDMFWRGLANTDDAELRNLVLQFELDLRHGDRDMSIIVKTLRLSQLVHDEWLSVEMTMAIQVWQAFVKSSSDVAMETMQAAGKDVSANDFVVSAYILGVEGHQSRHHQSAFSLQAIGNDTDHQPVLSIVQPADNSEALTLSPDGVQHMQNQQEESTRERRSSADPMAAPVWADNQSWDYRHPGRCHLFRYNVPSRLVSANILSPASIAFHICHGQCMLPFTSHMNASTHATLSVLWKQNRRMKGSEDSRDGGPQAHAEVSCVPVSFGPLSMNTLSPNGDVIVRTVRDISASTCGCR